MRGNGEQDRKIAEDVSTQLKSRGLRAPCHVNVVSNEGNVTLSGKIQYEHQRGLAIQVARSVRNVRRVVDQMQTLPQAGLWKAKPSDPHAPHDLKPPEPTKSAPAKPFDPMRMPT
jgi:hypothetical protein